MHTDFFVFPLRQPLILKGRRDIVSSSVHIIPLVPAVAGLGVEPLGTPTDGFSPESKKLLFRTQVPIEVPRSPSNCTEPYQIGTALSGG